MRWILCVLAFAAACKSRIPADKPGEFHAGIGFLGVPAAGVSVTAGQTFSDRREFFDLAFELQAAFQFPEDSPTRTGKWAQFQAGAKATLSPGHPRHVVLRAGGVWFRATGDPGILDTPGDYLGLYGGVGYEWDLTQRMTVGPEFKVLIVDGEGSLGIEVVPQFGLNWIVKF
ncbi:MAG: hypothetical protein ACT4PV_02220 [Planctomycetaceae bacterium]